jgi:alkylation response protein AidB-like acyl-CoA dehydrogenase
VADHQLRLRSHFIILARSGQAAGRPLLSALFVPRDAAGLTIVALPETMGCKRGQHGMVTLDGVRVDDEALLGGREGAVEAQLEETLDLSRPLVAASSLGTSERALELSVAHARTRVTFGKPLADRQAIQRYRGEMAADVNALRLMINDAARRADEQLPITAEASMCVWKNPRISPTVSKRSSPRSRRRTPASTGPTCSRNSSARSTASPPSTPSSSPTPGSPGHNGPDYRRS